MNLTHALTFKTSALSSCCGGNLTKISEELKVFLFCNFFN